MFFEILEACFGVCHAELTGIVVGVSLSRRNYAFILVALSPLFSSASSLHTSLM